MSQITIIKIAEVSARCGISRSLIYQMISVGNFPAQIKLSERSSGWIQSEITEWIEGRVSESRDLNQENPSRIPGDIDIVVGHSKNGNSA